MDVKGIVVFFVLAFGITFGIETALVLTDWITYDNRAERGPWLLRGLYLIPGIAAFFAHVITGRTVPTQGRFWPIPWFYIGLTIIAVSAVTILSFVAQALTGAAEPDFELKALEAQFEAQGMELAGTRTYVLVVGFMLSVFLGVFLYGPLCLPAEYAWRGFLLPRLLPLNRLRAYVLVGLLWGLWFAPVAFSEALGSLQPYSTLTRTILMALVLSVILGEVLRRTNSLTLCGVITGSFAAQTTGMTAYLFPEPNPPWSGPFGYVSVGVWLIAAIVVWCWPEGADTAAVEPENTLEAREPAEVDETPADT